jgi:hypothetical protein
MLGETIAALNVEFPSDYLAYARIYGTGTIIIEDAYEWEIYSPFRDTFYKFVRCFFDRQDVYRKATENEHVSLGLFPEPGGLLPFGYDDDFYFTWKTDGDPDSWTIVVIWLYQEGG